MQHVQLRTFAEFLNELSFALTSIRPVIDPEFDRPDTELQTLNTAQLRIEVLLEIQLAEFHELGERGRRKRGQRCIVVQRQFDLIGATGPSVVEDEDIRLTEVPGQRVSHRLGHGRHHLDVRHAGDDRRWISDSSLGDVEIVVALRPGDIDVLDADDRVVLIHVTGNFKDMRVGIRVVGGNASIRSTESFRLADHILDHIGIDLGDLFQSRVLQSPS